MELVCFSTVWARFTIHQREVRVASPALHLVAGLFRTNRLQRTAGLRFRCIHTLGNMRFLIALSSRSMSRQSYGGFPITAAGPLSRESIQLVGIPEPSAGYRCRDRHPVFFFAVVLIVSVYRRR